MLDVAALCEAVIVDAVKSMETTFKATADRMAADQMKANEDAEARAKALVSRGAQWLDEQWKETAREATESVVRELRQEREKVAELAQSARRAAWLSGGCAAVTAAALAGWMINVLSTVFH